jgi:hypothetical protein
MPATQGRLTYRLWLTSSRSPRNAKKAELCEFFCHTRIRRLLPLEGQTNPTRLSGRSAADNHTTDLQEGESIAMAVSPLRLISVFFIYFFGFLILDYLFFGFLFKILVQLRQIVVPGSHAKSFELARVSVFVPAHG